MMIYSARVEVPGLPAHDRARSCVLEPGVSLLELQEKCPSREEARKLSRKVKILDGPPSDSYPALWLDASLRPKPGLAAAVDKWLANHEVAIFVHPWRDCAYEEADECVRRKKLDARLANEIKSMLALNALPKHWGLWSCGAIAWKSECRRLRDAWWHWTQATGFRDQIALPLALRESGMRDQLFTVQEDIYRFFDWTPHGR